jgi:hypothetical protein
MLIYSWKCSCFAGQLRRCRKTSLPWRSVFPRLVPAKIRPTNVSSLWYFVAFLICQQILYPDRIWGWPICHTNVLLPLPQLPGFVHLRHFAPYTTVPQIIHQVRFQGGPIVKRIFCQPQLHRLCQLGDPSLFRYYRSMSFANFLRPNRGCK